MSWHLKPCVMFDFQPARKVLGSLFSISRLYSRSQQKSWFCLLVPNKLMICQMVPGYKYWVVLHITEEPHSPSRTETLKNHKRSINATALQLLYRPFTSNSAPWVVYFNHQLTWLRKYDFNWFPHTLIREKLVLKNINLKWVCHIREVNKSNGFFFLARRLGRLSERERERVIEAEEK